MKIYLVQHGKALSKEVDPDRSLSEEGRGEVEAVAHFLAKAGVTIPRIYHSGKTRAAQTARIFADNLSEGNIENQPGMAPNDDVAAFAAIIEGNGDALYVGHLPHLGKLASLLTTGDEQTEVAEIVNAGVLCLGTGAGGYRIEWYLTPLLCIFG